MKRVTISMDEDLARRVRVAAAQAGLSVSRFLADSARERISFLEQASESGVRNSQLEALERIFAGSRMGRDGGRAHADRRGAQC